MKVISIDSPVAPGEYEPSDAQQTRAWLLGLQWPSDVPFLDVLQCCDSLVKMQNNNMLYFLLVTSASTNLDTIESAVTMREWWLLVSPTKITIPSIRPSPPHICFREEA